MLKGKITIGRYINSLKPDTCYIKIEDVLSGTGFIEIQLTPEILGLALTGLSALDCVFETHEVVRVGKTREMKSEVIWIDPPLRRKNIYQLLRENAEVYKCDGWLPMIYDGTRYEPIEKSDNGWAYRINFVRWTEATP